MEEKLYIIEDTFEGTKEIEDEKYLRDLYNSLLDMLLSLNPTPQDKEYRENIYKEKEEVYKIDIKSVIRAITDIDKYYIIKEYEV